MIHDRTLPDRLVSLLPPDGVAIFLFHGVIPLQRHAVRNYTGKHIQALLFAECMRRLAAAGQALSMDEVLASCESGERLPPRAFAITFDDGFENNRSIAAPILADFKIPATIYVTSDFIERNGMSWIDRIEQAVEEAPAQVLHVDWAQAAFPLTDPESRIAFLNAVRKHVKSTPGCDPNAFADTLTAQLGKTDGSAGDDQLDLKLTWAQVRELHESELFTIGGHSHTHPILSFLKPDQLAVELDTSLSMLREKAAVGPTHYSYPEGLEHCYSDEVITALKQRGVRCCPTAIEGINRAGHDPFQLRRIMVG
jgi:peptidoglycan/xylan/chitin deacetylase (PgdA/CDA1 family)